MSTFYCDVQAADLGMLTGSCGTVQNGRFIVADENEFYSNASEDNYNRGYTDYLRHFQADEIRDIILDDEDPNWVVLAYGDDNQIQIGSVPDGMANILTRFNRDQFELKIAACDTINGYWLLVFRDKDHCGAPLCLAWNDEYQDDISSMLYSDDPVVSASFDSGRKLLYVVTQNGKLHVFDNPGSSPVPGDILRYARSWASYNNSSLKSIKISGNMCYVCDSHNNSRVFDFDNGEYAPTGDVQKDMDTTPLAPIEINPDRLAGFVSLDTPSEQPRPSLDDMMSLNIPQPESEPSEPDGLFARIKKFFKR